MKHEVPGREGKTLKAIEGIARTETGVKFWTNSKEWAEILRKLCPGIEVEVFDPTKQVKK